MLPVALRDRRAKRDWRRVWRDFAGWWRCSKCGCSAASSSASLLHPCPSCDSGTSGSKPRLPTTIHMTFGTPVGAPCAQLSGQTYPMTWTPGGTYVTSGGVHFTFDAWVAQIPLGTSTLTAVFRCVNSPNPGDMSMDLFCVNYLDAGDVCTLPGTCTPLGWQCTPAAGGWPFIPGNCDISNCHPANFTFIAVTL
jgi:hypothetical protein